MRGEKAAAKPESHSYDLDVAKVSTALSTWAAGGRDELLQLISAQAATAAAEPTASTVLMYTLYRLLSSEQEAPAVVGLIKDVVAAAPEPIQSTVATAFLDTIEESCQAERDVKDSSKAHDPTLEAKALNVVNGLVTSKAVSQHFINLLISPEHLLSTGLHPTPRNPDHLIRAMAKLNTSTYFKQRNSNLLREASEGFSHLIILLTGPSVLLSTPETDEQRLARAKSAWNDVENVIGTYNLAPIRVLDLIIEVASLHVAAHWRFFMDLLRVSYWGRYCTGPSQLKPNSVQDEAESIARSVELVDSDNSTIAKALGFWFTFYQNPDNGDTPTGLLYFAALLVKDGFVKPAFLLPNLSPDDDGMADIEARYKSAMSSRSGPMNALMNTVLVDDEAPTSTSDKPAEVEEKPKAKAEQKIQLLQALMAIGEVEFSLKLLAKYPWVAMAYPAIGQHIIRNVDYSLDPVYRHVTSQPGYGAAPARPVGEVVYTLSSPPPPATATKTFEFFYSTWFDHLQHWENVQDIYVKGDHWLRLLGGLGGRATRTMVKICRIMKVHFEGLRKQKFEALGLTAGAPLKREEVAALRPTQAEIDPWNGVIRGVLLPALSLSDDATAAFDHELEQVFDEFPWETLACLFGEWRDLTGNNKARGHLPPAANATTKATRDIKQALSRVTAAQSNPGVPTPASQASERVPARALAKQGRANPVALWSVSNSQVMAYGSVGNIGEHIIEVGRYTNRLSKDVAVFTWVDQLASSSTNQRSIENLSVFVGLINRRFVFSLDPLLQFIISGLKSGNSSTLTVVEKILSGMSGEDIVGNFAISIEQLSAYTAGPEMCREAFYSTEITRGDRRPRRSHDLLVQVKKSLPRLIQALRYTDLAVPILVGLAQMSTNTLLFDLNTSVKEMSDERDFAWDVFAQYGQLVAEHLSLDERAAFPTLSELQHEYGIDPQHAWTILRYKLAAMQKLAPAAEETMEVDGETNWWPAALTSTINEVEADDTLLDKRVKNVLGSAFFVRFNSLQASDIDVASFMYDKAIGKITKLIHELAAPKTTTSEMRNEIVRLRARVKQLQAEKEQQEAHVKRVREQLKRESAHWFSGVRESQPQVLVGQLHDQCFYPRAIRSPADAVFVAKFIRLAHDFGTPGFSTALTYNTFFLRETLADKIFESTEAEARNLGRALYLIMSDLDSWYQHEDRYYSQALGGAVPEKVAAGETKVIPEHALTGMHYRVSTVVPNTAHTWEDFKNFYAKFHDNLTTSLIKCWTPASPSYSPKNAVVIALQLLPFYPVMKNNADAIQKAVINLRDKKDGSITPDIVPAFNSYLSQLSKRNKTERPFVPAAEFHPSAAIRAANLAKAKAAKAKAEAEAKAAAAAEAKAAAGPENAGASAEPSAEATTTAETTTDAAAAAAGAVSDANLDNARALRAKLEQGRSTRAATREARAAGGSPTPPAAHPLPVNPTLASRHVHPDRAAVDRVYPDRGHPDQVHPDRVHPDRVHLDRAAVHPDRAAAVQSMGPPAELSVDEARAAARARKFGMIANAAPPAGPRDDSARSTPRHSPPPRGQRSGTEDSRLSDRERRHDGRDGRRDPREGERRDDRRGDARDDRRDAGRTDERRDAHPRDERHRDDRRRDGRDERDLRRRDERRPDARDAGRDARGGGRDARDSREERRDAGPPRVDERRDVRERRDGREPRDAREPRGDGRETRDGREPRDGRELRDGRERREPPRDAAPPTGPARDRVPPAAGDDKERRPDRPDSRNESRGDRERPDSRGGPQRPESRSSDRDRREPARAGNDSAAAPSPSDRPPHVAEEREDRKREREGRDREDERRVRSRRDEPRRDGRDREREERPRGEGTPRERGGDTPASGSGKGIDPSAGRETPRGGGGTPRGEREPRDGRERESRGGAPAPTPPNAPPAATEPAAARGGRRESLRIASNPAPRLGSPAEAPRSSTPRERERERDRDRDRDRDHRGGRELLRPSSSSSSAPSLAARMGLAPASAAAAGGEDGGRKRGLDEVGGSREDSPGASKRRRGGGGRRGGERGGDGPAGRMLAGAMRAAAGDK